MDGELDAAADLTVRFWVDGVGREPGEVDADVRRLVYDMQLRAYQHAQEGGDAAEELELVEDAGDHADEVPAPTLLVVGDHDQPDILRIAERLSHEIPGAVSSTSPTPPTCPAWSAHRSSTGSCRLPGRTA